MKRSEIEQQQRCEWFDRACPKCGKLMLAYGTPPKVPYDYALLCPAHTCENWSKVVLMGDQYSIEDADIESLDIEHVVRPPVIYSIPDEIPGHPVADWLHETQAGETKLDYPEWVEQRYQDNPDDYCRTCFEPYAGNGDGWDGECPICADRTAARKDEG